MISKRVLQISSKISLKTLNCRWYCEKGVHKFSHTILVPKETIPLRLDGAKRKEMDKHILEQCDFKNIYKHFQMSGTKVFVLHDGPPYANGSLHVGHAVNKILKDITNRVKALQGYQVHYVPGWDCHGLPIELKALTNNNGIQGRYENEKLNLSGIMEIRNRARNFASEAILNQKATFERWGIIANWDKCYHTFDMNYVVEQLSLFYQLYEMGYIFRDFKPVYWSYSSRTALAEAELEYNDKHKSTSLFFKCLLKSASELFECDGVYALVWTTTPWTIPCNKAICYAFDKKYCVVQCEETTEKYLIVSDLKDYLEKTLSKRFLVLKELDSKMLEGVRYYHPITNVELPLLPGKHVTSTHGTGLVHTAPAHGPDDFLVAIKNNISVECLVDEDGKYTKEVDSLQGKFVLGEGNQLVMKLLKDNVVSVQDHFHSYPYDWRTKKPVIIRASSQWFIDTDLLKATALAALNRVRVIPEEAKSSMISQLKNRPYWCISRQRVWGVPIPVFYDKETQKPLINKQIFDHLIHLLKEHGTDFWWTLPDEVLLPKHLLKNVSENQTFVKGKDILDIWFDSGSSWKNVLRDSNYESDFLVEGTDQLNGWFQSTLLLSCALNKKAPYRNLYVHGFVTDENGRKMSKSLGNVIDPCEITDGGKKIPCYGADVLRWWVAVHGAHSTIPIGHRMMKSCCDDVQKIRTTLRFLVGILHDFTPLEDFQVSSLRLLDQYMLHRLMYFKEKVIDAYDTFKYNRVGILIRAFVTNDVSAFYCSIIKDRVYCESVQSCERQSALTVCSNLLTILLQLLSPVLPFLTEEVHLKYPVGQKPYLSNWNLPTTNNWENLALSRTVEKLIVIRDEVNKIATSGQITLKSYNLTIISDVSLNEELKSFQNEEVSSVSELSEFFQVAKITRKIRNMDDPYPVDGQICHLMNQGDELNNTSAESEKCCIVLDKSEKHACPRCRRQTSNFENKVCSRCENVLECLK